MGRWSALLLAVVASCYRGGEERACHVRCEFDPATSTGQCPANLACFSDGLCREADGQCPVEPQDDAGFMDAPSDGLPDSATPSLCYGHPFQICLASDPNMDRTINGNVDTDTMCDEVVAQGGNGIEVCVIRGDTVTVMPPDPLRATGSRPLVLIAKTVLTVSIDIRVESFGSERGAGSRPIGTPIGNPAAIHCPAFAQSPTFSGLAASGGAGGTAGTSGAIGGQSTNTVPGTPAPLGGTPTFVRAGCDGQPGALAGTSMVHPFGLGGGAVYLIAGERLTMGG